MPGGVFPGVSLKFQKCLKIFFNHRILSIDLILEKFEKIWKSTKSTKKYKKKYRSTLKVPKSLKKTKYVY